MGSMNKAILIGNLGRDAEVRYTASGTAVATLSLATTESWKDKDGQKQERTEWHRVVVWDKTADALKDYLVKGKQIAVEGKIQTRKWEDKDGATRYTTEIKSDRITLLSGVERRDEHDQRRGSDKHDDEVDSHSQVNDDDLPF